MLPSHHQLLRRPPTPRPPRRRDKERGFQLYQSDPSGNYGGWKATAIGANHQAASNVLQGDYSEELTLEEVGAGGPGAPVRAARCGCCSPAARLLPPPAEGCRRSVGASRQPPPVLLSIVAPGQAIKLVVKVLSKTMDSTTLSPDKVELATLSRDEAAGKARAARGWQGQGGLSACLCPCCPVPPLLLGAGCAARCCCCPVPLLLPLLALLCPCSVPPLLLTSAQPSSRSLHPLLLPLLPHPGQVLYKVYEPSELKPVLDAVNADMTKEKEKAK